MMKLYSGDLSPYSARVRLQIYAKGITDITLERPAHFGTPKFREEFPIGRIPVLEWLTAGRFYGIPHTLIAFLIITVVMGVVLHRSVFGRYLFAVGKNEEAARYSGIHTSRIVIAAYVICCGLTAVAALAMDMLEDMQRKRTRTVEQIGVALLQFV